MSKFKLRCMTCDKSFEDTPGLYTCNICGPLLGTLEVLYPLETMDIKKDFKPFGSLFQYEELLPVSSHTVIDKFIGGTPLIEFVNVFNLDKLLIKFDGISFSGSYKDRASIIAINKALEEGNNHIFCASTGNAASSLALLSAHTSLETTIFVPSKIPKAKLAQLQVAGATILPIEASYDQVFDIALEIGLSNGWYTRNSAINPYLLEGKKTGAYEIIVQNNYESPDYCFVGVGDGTIISAICKGFHEFFELGLINKIPKVIGVQAEGACTLKKVYDAGEPYIPIAESVDTIADSISVGNPRDVIKACKYLKRNNGLMISVSDYEIIDSIKELAKTTGVFSEPAGAVTLAGLKKLQNEGIIKKSDSVCLIITGNGLKDAEAAKGSLEQRYFTVKEVYEYFNKEVPSESSGI